MSNVAESKSRELESGRESANVQPAVERPSVAEVVARISADSRVQPKQYLEESVAPLGGE